MICNAIILCASAFLVQSIAGNCIRPTFNPISIPNCGGALITTSLGPISPSGIAVTTDLSLDGNLDLSGTLPFLGAVAFDGSFPNSGTAEVSYSCGDGNIGITEEFNNPSGSNAVLTSGLSISSAGLGGCKRS